MPKRWQWDYKLCLEKECLNRHLWHSLILSTIMLSFHVAPFVNSLAEVHIEEVLSRVRWGFNTKSSPIDSAIAKFTAFLGIIHCRLVNFWCYCRIFLYIFGSKYIWIYVYQENENGSFIFKRKKTSINILCIYHNACWEFEKVS